MKKWTILIPLFFILSSGYSQNFLTGPKAKNAHLAPKSKLKVTIWHDSKTSPIQGPIAKNTEVWMEESARKFKVGFRDEVNNPQGLKAKNKNPWDTPASKVSTKASYQLPKSMRPKKGWIH